MTGVGAAQDANARLEIFDVDEFGNWPMLLEARGLRPLPEGRLYELWLTKDGRLAEPCGRFAAEADGVDRRASECAVSTRRVRRVGGGEAGLGCAAA